MTFGLAVAVGLTPQMLPMIVTTNLARGVRIMRTKKIAIRRMDAVQNLGAMCVPPTFTQKLQSCWHVTHGWAHFSMAGRSTIYGT